MDEIERELRLRIIRNKPSLKNGYYYFTHKLKHYKRSRIIKELQLGVVFDINEFVHHINKNKCDDRLENLKVISGSEHTSLHHAGLRRKSTH